MKRYLKLNILMIVLIFPLSYSTASAGGGSKAAASKYFSITPPMVVNVSDKGKVRHLQVGIQLRLENPADGTFIEEHKPAIQHELVMLLSGQEAKEIRSVKGKEKLRTDATAAIQKFLTDNIGKPLIKAVYFTTFVIQ